MAAAAVSGVAKKDLTLFVEATGMSIWSKFGHVYLQAAGVPFEAVKVALGAGEHLKPEHIAINPRHKVPFLVDTKRGNFGVKESASIARYVSALYKPKAGEVNLFPQVHEAAAAAASGDVKDVKALQHASEIDQAVELVRDALGIPVATIGFNAYARALAAGKFGEFDVPTTQARFEWVDKGLKFIEETYFKSAPNRTIGTDLSYADLVLYVATEHLAPLQFSYAAYPRVAAFRTALHKEIGTKILDPIHADFHVAAAAALKLRPFVAPKTGEKLVPPVVPAAAAAAAK